MSGGARAGLRLSAVAAPLFPAFVVSVPVACWAVSGWACGGVGCGWRAGAWVGSVGLVCCRVLGGSAMVPFDFLFGVWRCPSPGEGSGARDLRVPPSKGWNAHVTEKQTALHSAREIQTQSGLRS